MTSSQVLVVLQQAADADRVLAGVDVVHRVAPTVMIVQVPPGVRSPLTDAAGVRYVGQDPPLELLTDLDEGERLFVEGWIARETQQASRSREGLNWDAEGMTPPDKPPHV
jgi:hypothetical protein